MSAWALRAIAVGVAASAPLLGGCSAESGGSSSGGGGAGPAYSTSAGGGGGAASTQPMLVDVDPNLTLTAQPGEGVGVFTEYRTGGHWHVWWTCDTNQTGLGCHFDVAVSTSGAITNLAGEGLQATDQVLQASASQITAITQTSTAIGGVTFDTSPAAIITLDAKMDGQDRGDLLFFVQRGQVNGGYTGTLTDPLMLEPSTP
jgi:hypothetical protein